MSIASKYNKGGINWGIETDGFQYHSLSELGEGAMIQVKGIFINHKGKFGPSPVIIAEDCYFNLPGYMTDTVKDMLQDQELIAAIKVGKVAAEVRKFTDSRYNKESWAVDWKDV